MAAYLALTQPRGRALAPLSTWRGRHTQHTHQQRCGTATGHGEKHASTRTCTTKHLMVMPAYASMLPQGARLAGARPWRGAWSWRAAGARPGGRSCAGPASRPRGRGRAPRRADRRGGAIAGSLYKCVCVCECVDCPVRSCPPSHVTCVGAKIHYNHVLDSHGLAPIHTRRNLDALKTTTNMRSALAHGTSHDASHAAMRNE